jgi:hypothetical protein
MPKPVFIICAQIATQDRDSNLLSLTNVLEQIAVRWHPQEDQSKEVKYIHLVTFSIVAVWTRAADDGPDDEYQAEMWVRYPGDEAKEILMKLDNYRFDASADALQRMVAHVRLEPPSVGGVIHAGSRTRKVGKTQWLTQEYSMRLVVHGSPENPADASAGGKPKKKRRGRSEA